MEELIHKLQKCTYCKKELDLGKSKSEWDHHTPYSHHYLSIKCDCGKSNWIKLYFFNSGHNYWLGKDFHPATPIFNKVRQ